MIGSASLATPFGGSFGIVLTESRGSIQDAESSHS
jgi:hypothetical protein